jgi:hypothetical protein
MAVGRAVIGKKKQRITEDDLKTIASALLALSVLAGIAGQVNAADLSGSKSYEQPEREIR